MIEAFASEVVLVKGAKIALIVVGGAAARVAVRAFVRKLRRQIKKSSSETVQQAKQRVATVTSLLLNTTNFLVSLLVVFLILSELGVNVAPLLAGAGILGLGIGLATKDLAADLVAGFFLLLENEINVGDQVQIGASAGRIKKISLRTLTLEDKDNRRHIIPNSNIKVIIKDKKR